MAVNDWSTNWESGTVDTTTEMPTLQNNVDFTRISHYHALRDAVIQCEKNQYDKMLVASADPGADVSIAGTYVQFMPSSGTETIAVAYAREFIVMPICAFGAGSLSTFEFKVVFDEGESNVQTVGDSDIWRTRGDNGGAYRSINFAEAVTLTAGNHTVKAYAKRTNGASAGTVYGSSGALGATGYIKPAVYLF